MGKALSEDTKAKISELYQNNSLSVGGIADKLGVSVSSVRRYRHYLNQDPSESMFVENTTLSSQDPVPQTSQTIEEPEEAYQSDRQEEETIEDYEPSEEKSWPREEVKECPECGKSKSECWTIDQALEQGIPINEVAKQFYDYICPKDGRFFTDYRYRIQGICPGSGCHSTSRDWMPIEQHPYAKEEEIEKYDFICLECHELIKIVD